MSKNPYAKIEDFANVVTDKNALQVFLAIAKNEVRNIDQILKDTSLDLTCVALSVDKLEKGDFIIRNPNQLSRKFKLGFNGQLFAEQLRMVYPEVRALLGDRAIIQPIRVSPGVTLSSFRTERVSFANELNSANK